MAELLDTAAVGRKTGEEAAVIFTAYFATSPVMVSNHTLDAVAKNTGPAI